MAKKNIKSSDFLPEFIRTDKNKKFLSSTLDQLIQPAQIERVDGFIGSKLTPTYNSTSNNYISETSEFRRNYNLEPALVVYNTSNQIQKVIGFDDLTNEISVVGGINNNLDRLYRPDYYSYDPYIDWDKFVNYQEYYWLITGPDTVEITGKPRNSTSTYTVNNTDVSFIFTPDGLNEDPIVTLYRGNTYNFQLNGDKNLYIKIAPSPADQDLYLANTVNNGTSTGILSIIVDVNTPSTLYYASDDQNFQGKILVQSASENTIIDVEKEVVGKKNYKSGNGVELTNGMKVRFGGVVSPEFYQEKEFFVEGVGEYIRLVDYDSLLSQSVLGEQLDDDFDVAPFDNYPFDNFKTLPITPEYITINRASRDLNPWTRYNRWFHSSVIKLSAELNGVEPVYPADNRAKRPIIEFKPNLQLFNYGSFSIPNVDIIDNYTKDAFKFIEGSSGAWVDGVLLQQGHRVIFNADADDKVRGKVYQVNFAKIKGLTKTQLIEVLDPTEGASVSVALGETSGGRTYWFNGNKWIYSQQKNLLNQSPIFDLFDNQGISYSNKSYYLSNFRGNRIFSYARGTGDNDPVLGFPLVYKNSVGVGSYVFKNYFMGGFFSITNNEFSTTSTTVTTALSYIKINDELGEKYDNVWKPAQPYQIPVIQFQSPEVSTSTIEINCVETPINSVSAVDVFVNEQKIKSTEFTTTSSYGKLYVQFNEQQPANSNIQIKVQSDSPVDNTGFYEVPINLTNNPLNGPILDLTLSEITDHVSTMVNRSPDWSGVFPGISNLRDLPNISSYGTRLISNANPIPFAQLFIGNPEHSVINALSKVADHYGQFKMEFLRRISRYSDQKNYIQAVDDILKNINARKNILSSYYYSDMLAYGQDKTVRTWTVTSTRNKVYPISSDFNPSVLSTRSVLVYLNETQLNLGTDYIFLVNDSSVEFLVDLAEGDVIEIHDYPNTEGCYVPPTPTKLGLYPKFRPHKYRDNTYVGGSRWVIQCHDGSIMLAYNDYRDRMVLELERRIYNNIKTEYREDLFSINDVIPGAFRKNNYSLEEVNQILQADFMKWAGIFGINYQENDSFEETDAFTWNYTGTYNSLTSEYLSGYWRNIYKYFYDTDYPHSKPWEMLGISVKPLWWEEEYGPAPYTSGNDILWNDLEQGLIRQGDNAGIHTRYARPGLSTILPVDESGNLIDPSILIAANSTPSNRIQGWKFGDQGPVETAWRRSSFWPFAVQRLMALTNPAKYASLMFDTSRMSKNIAGQWTYGDKKSFLNPKNLTIFEDNNSLAAGYSVYVVEIGKVVNKNYVYKLKSDIEFMDINLFHKVGGFISKDKVRFIIDAVAPTSTDPGSLLPQENYNLNLNVSSPVEAIGISGIVIQKSNGKFIVKGYDRYRPYFNVLKPTRNTNTPTITVGGISEPFVTWNYSSASGNTGLSSADTTTASAAATGNFYQQGRIVKYGNKFYRVKVSHSAESTFDPTLYTVLSTLPIKGGRTVQIAKGFETEVTKIPYGTSFSTIQDVYDFIVGHGQYLISKGFIFDDYNADLGDSLDWNFSAKEFLYWTTQNWADNSLITLSPFANQIKFKKSNTVVDNLFALFYDYSILRADGTAIPPKNLNVTREDGLCTISTTNTTDGIFFANIRPVQKEHGMIFDNSTIFNDVIFDIETGYRQRRMKMIGFRTSGWDGDYFNPGFVYDKAVVSLWAKYKNYQYGDVVKFNGKHYSAKTKIIGKESFNVIDGWVELNEAPVSDLLPNLDYKINQFEDFYALDIDNFDSAQQKMSQHLIGYTPRVYLNNITTDPIAQYKFYQGFIKEKGTKNSIKKISKASIYNQQGDIDFNEEWAFRTGFYGSYQTYQELEVPLVEGTFIENPQVVNFVDVKPLVQSNDLIYYSTASSLSISPDNFNPTEAFVVDTSTFDNTNFKFPVAGYVKFGDVTATAYNENSLLDIANNADLNEGDTVWLGFKTNGDWDVLRYEKAQSNIVGVYVSSPGIDITFTTDYFHDLNIGDIVSISQFNEQVNGIYKVIGIPKLNQFTVASSLTSIVNAELPSPGLMFRFKSQRYTNFDNIPADQILLKLPYGSKFWIDENADGKWEVYQKTKNYSSISTLGPSTPSDQRLGWSIAKKSDNNVIVVGSPGFVVGNDKGRVFVYKKINGDISFKFSYTINSDTSTYYTSTATTELGYSVDYSTEEFNNSGYGIFFAGAPATSGIKSLMFPHNTVRKSLGTESTSSFFSQEGLVKISSVDPIIQHDNTEFILLDPNPKDFGRFGSSVSYNLSNRRLLVSSPGTLTTGTGHVHAFTITNTTTVSVTYKGSYALPDNATTGTLFGSSISNIDSGIVAIGAPGFDSQAGIVTIYNTTTTSLVFDRSRADSYAYTSLKMAVGLLPKDYSFDLTNDGSIDTGDTILFLRLSLYGNVRNDWPVGQRSSYDTINQTTGSYQSLLIPTIPIAQSIYAPAEFTGVSGFGETVVLSEDGNNLFVAAPLYRNQDLSYGAVVIYEKDNTGLFNTSSYTVLRNPLAGSTLNFGYSMGFNKETDTLVVSAVGNSRPVISFDGGDTTFDSQATRVYGQIENIGTSYVYNRKLNRFVLADELTLDEYKTGNDFGYATVVTNNEIYIGAPAYESTATSGFYQFNKIDSSLDSWQLLRQQDDTVNIDQFQKVSLIDTFNERIIEYLDIIDPLKGKIPGLADQEIKYKSSFDPAIYSIGLAGTVNDTSVNWLDEHVGELWWDLSTVKYVWYEQGELSYRKNNWGKLFPGATIDVYEWVGSDLLPSEWSSQADTSAGLTSGVSGQPKFADNSVISVKQVYSPVTNSFSNRYYYWVKNKVIVPAVKNRRISSYQVASLIADPTSYGYNYASFLSKDSVAFSNIGTKLVDSRIHANIALDTINNQVQKHTEWLLIPEGDANSGPNYLLEKKLFDSLLGHDSLGNLVPDPALSDRTKYGLGIRPQQTLFKDRRQALRNLIEFSNNVLLKNQITGNYSFVNLNQQEPPPDIHSNEWDQSVEDNEALLLINTVKFVTAELTCTVKDGKLRSVQIINPGYGYKIAPKIKFNNATLPVEDAIVSTVIDSDGRVVKVNIEYPGSGYSSVPELLVRPYTVIVLTDTLYNGKWTKFQWNTSTLDWDRIQTQKYNTPLYWNYVDWASETYNKFIDYTYTVDELYEVNTLTNLKTGQYIKVKNPGDGLYIILEKTAPGTAGTFDNSFNLVYKENGTIQIDNGIWDVSNNNLGFDKNNSYDQTLYDQTLDLELQYILTALKKDIFVNELKINWNLFFFKAVKYALSEQKLLDWAFKTSFIDVTNYAGNLDQRPVYKLQNSDYYEDFVKEAKPFHTQIRKFTTNHGVLEPSQTFVTDFDLPSVYNSQSGMFESVEEDNDLINSYPWKAWSDNNSFYVESIVVGNPGNNYVIPPVVNIETAPGDSGIGATAVAYISSGKVSQVVVTNAGKGYKKAPIVTLVGGGSEGLEPAIAYAKLTNGKVRTNLIGIKFDRVGAIDNTGARVVTDEFVCNGNTSEFTLNWLAQPDKSKITVTLDGAYILSSDYTIKYYTEEVGGYQKRFSKIVFLNYTPNISTVLKVTYAKNVEIFDAAGRILNYYTATSGMPGMDMAQLMTGVEYPKTQLKTVGFDHTSKWDVQYEKNGTQVFTAPFEYVAWADDVSAYTKVAVKTSIPGYTFSSTVVLTTTTGIMVGQYANHISALTNKFSSSTVMVKSINTAASSVTFDSTGSGIYSGDIIEFWSVDSNFSILDSAIDGGSWEPNKKLVSSAVAKGTDTVTLSSISDIKVGDSLIVGHSEVSNKFKNHHVSVVNVISTLSQVKFSSTTTATISVGEVVRFRNSPVLLGARGVNPEDIIIDGDGFFTPNTSYATEEFVPGESADSIGLNVYTKNGTGAPLVYTGYVQVNASKTEGTTAVLGIQAPNPDSITVVYGNKILQPSARYNAAVLDSDYYYLDYDKNEIFIGPRSVSDQLGYTIISVGGEAVVDHDTVTSYFTNTAQAVSLAYYTDIKRAYVTVNGEIISTTSTSFTNKYYDLTYASPIDKRAAVRVYNLDPTSSSTVQAWFFDSDSATYNEVREETYVINSSTQYSGSEIVRPPGNIEPYAPQVIFEISRNTDSKGFVRLLPPFVSYYNIVNERVRTYSIDNSRNHFNNFSAANTQTGFTVGNVSVYVNGESLAPGFEYTVEPDLPLMLNPTVTIADEILAPGDVVAIVSKPDYGWEFDIVNKQMVLNDPVTNCVLKLITYTDHDQMLMRTERFKANNYRRFKISRTVMNNNYVWVQLNRIPLVNKIDYILLEDGRTIQLNDEIPMSPAGTVYKDVVSTNIVGGDFGGLYTDGIPGVFNVTITLDSYVLSHRYSWGYEVGDVLKIYGSQVGGTDGINDITITVTATDGDYGITEYDVVGKIPEYEVVISSFSSQEVNSDVLGYRIFNDIFGRTSFKRLSRKNTTYLTQPLSYTHTEIHVADAGVLTPPSVARKLPGVVLIDGERIEYYKTEGNVLKQLRRGTMGTGPRFILEPNTRVIDQGVNQTVPFNEQILVQNTLTTTSRNYTISTASTLVIGDGIKLSVGPPSDTIDIDVATAARDQAQLMANNVIDDDLAYDLNGDNVVDNLDVIAYNALINGTPLGFSPVSTSNYADMFVKTYTVPAVDQVSVYYGGRLLNKASTYHHDTTISYDSPEFNLLGNVATVFDLPVSTVDYLTVNDAYIVTATNEVWIYKNSVETDAINGFVWRGLKYVPPEFTINTSTQVITLNMLEPVVPGVKLTVVKKQFNRNTSWNDIVDDSTTLSLLESTSTQARFLQARPSELPDKYYYGGTTALTDSGIPITDRNGDPLLGL